MRQAVYELRSRQGSEMVDSSPTWCRLSEKFDFESDCHTPSLRDSQAFLPAAEGDWFESRRTEVEVRSHDPDEDGDSMVGTLHWLARHDQKNFFKLLRETPGLVRGIDFAEQRELIRIARRRTPEVRGWSLFWRGVVEEDLSICARCLVEAFEHARVAQDEELASEIALELGKVFARRGKAKRAYRVARIAADVADRSRTVRLKTNSLRLEGILSCYFGDGSEGLIGLERAEDQIEDALGRVLSRMSRAYFTASVGRSEEALDLLEALSVETRGLRHASVASNERIARAIAIYRLRTGDWGRSLMQAALEESIRTGFTQHGVCAAELLAQIDGRHGEPASADRYLRHAAQGRRVSNAVKTPLEFRRERLLDD